MNQHELDILDKDQKRRYKGRVFFFEKYIVYTEAIERGRLQFRGYYMLSAVSIVAEEGKNKFILYNTKRGNKEIECFSEFIAIPFWTESVHEVIINSLNCK